MKGGKRTVACQKGLKKEGMSKKVSKTMCTHSKWANKQTLKTKDGEIEHTLTCKNKNTNKH